MDINKLILNLIFEPDYYKTIINSIKPQPKNCLRKSADDSADMANLIKQVTHDEFSHSCIAFNSKLDPMYSFGRKQLDLGNTGFVINSPQDDFFRGA